MDQIVGLSKLRKSGRCRTGRFEIGTPMTFEHEDFVLLRKAIKTSIGVATVINMPKLDHERLVQLLKNIDEELKKEIKDEDDSD